MKGSHVAAFLIGAIAGGVAALLYAPQSGKKTRKQIREYVGEFVERTTAKAKDAVSRGVKQVRHGVSQAREFVNNEIAGVRAELCDCENKEE